MLVKCITLFFIVSFSVYETGLAIPEDERYWQGNWFPVDPGTVDNDEVVDKTFLGQLTQKDNNVKDSETKPDMRDEKHGILMGIIDKDCDDAKTNLTVDWDGSSVDYTCFEHRYKPNYKIRPIQVCDDIPAGFWARHYCMNISIEYSHKIPTFGDHRPLWAAYGEFKYVPVQRWLHNLEHGGIVMLYHPCANIKQVNKLKKILKSCMWKHLITAFPDLNEDRPIALLSWGCRYLMNVVDKNLVTNFIKTHAMKGPELMYGQGFYKKTLVSMAYLISDLNDTKICPHS